ncbi:MAG: hypothetical protein RLO12_11310 [Fulvivirga sp.]
MSEVMMTLDNNQLELVYETNRASLHQCDTSEIYTLRFNSEVVEFRVCQLIAFKRKIQKIDLAQMFADDTADIEIVYMPHCDRLFALNIHDVLQLKELFDGAFAMLELNSMIHKELVRRPL